MIHVHVAQDANIKFVAANNAKNPCRIRLCKGFYNSTKCVIFIKKSTLDTFFFTRFSLNSNKYVIIKREVIIYENINNM